MKTSEFIKEAEKLGFSVVVQEDAVYVRIFGFNKHWIMRIWNDFCGYIRANFSEVPWKYDFKALYELAIEYAFTPIDERKNEPRFKVKLTPLSNSFDSLWIGARDDDLDVTSWLDAVAFTPAQYHLFPDNHPEWKPFLHDYDPDNTAVFVPVEADK